ncbi:DUF257 family protein [Pyrococcus abyssi]|uniref:Uncharacterized protein n=1 Tax=Pyrococcus abyssi (strain GE5 / Orsay) TaxID=272844 RepID=Q9V1K3_PYRAB|nr:DUF257 family protein [Pyrococcus abyssi]CAB49346.1 Hypothetical protein PAB2065 [Pyrococcus abyssi GE5]CCE69804.1 TPA: hypothetical protein PAB2065 [Pyrococcus abyssi GE5]
MEIDEIVNREKISVLIEYTSRDIIGPGLFRILKSIKEKYGDDAIIIITDFLDALPIHKYQAELIGIDTKIIDSSAIIKVGGRISSGNVIYKIPISSYPVYKTLYEESLKKLLDGMNPRGKFFINIQIGIEGLMNVFERKEIMEQIHDIGEYIVTKDRDIRDIMFLNIDYLKSRSIDILPMLRTIFPVVIRLMNDGRSFSIMKSVFPNIKGSVGTIKWE